MDYSKMIKISKNEWVTNSDICGFRVIFIDGYYEVYSFDECYEDDFLEEKDTNLLYLQTKYGFKLETLK